jgi:cytochrome c-type biogenesis protein CcmE
MSDATPLELTPETPVPVRSSRRRTYAVIGVLVLAVGALLAQGMLSSLNYYKTVDEVFADRASVGTREVRLEGVVQKGSVERTSTGADFVIAGADSNQVRVSAVGEPPQLFRPNIPVVVVGSFTSATGYEFRATQIMVKHSAEYKAKYPDRVKAPDGTVR